MPSSTSLMSNKNSEEKSTDLNRRIILTEKEVSEISSLYEAALKLSEKSFNSQDRPSDQKNTIISLDDFNSSSSVIQRKKAWHAVQEYLEILGKKYDYDPEKFVINKLTRELEPYKPDL